MDRLLFFALLIVPPCAVFSGLTLLRLWRGQIYRADDLDRVELNRMHRHTVWNALLCAVMLAVAVAFPSVRLYLGFSALVMLLFVLPLRTVFIEMGIRYNRKGKPRNA